MGNSPQLRPVLYKRLLVMKIITLFTLAGATALFAGCTTTNRGAGTAGDEYYVTSGSASSDSTPDALAMNTAVMNTASDRGSGALNTGTGGGGIAVGTGIGSGSTGTGHP
jgi:hypothetical protein